MARGGINKAVVHKARLAFCRTEARIPLAQPVQHTSDPPSGSRTEVFYGH